MRNYGNRLIQDNSFPDRVSQVRFNAIRDFFEKSRSKSEFHVLPHISVGAEFVYFQCCIKLNCSYSSVLNS